MDVWLRLGRYVWPYRWSVISSLLIGLGVGGLWSAELLLTFPVIKIFLQGQSLPDYVRQEVVSAQSTHATLQAELDRVQTRVAALPSVEQTPAGDRRQRAKLLSDQSTLQRKLNLAAERLAWSVWIEARIVPRLPRDQFRLLQVVFSLLLAVTVLKGALSFWQDSIAGSIGERAVVDLRRDLFRKVLKLDPLTVAEVGSARWTAYFTYHLQLVSGGLNELSGRVVREPLKGVACIVAALAINWRLTALSLCVVPVAAWLYHRYGQSLRRATRRAMDSMNRIFRSLEETFENLRAVQLFDRAGLHRRKFHRQNREFYQHSLRIVRTEAMCGPVLELLGLLAVFVALLPAAYLVLHGQTHLFGVRLTTSPMDIAELSVLYTLLAGTLDPLRKFTKFYANFRRTGTVAELIFQHLDLPSRVVDGTGLSQRLSLEDSIEFRGVSFEYGAPAADSRPILDRVDLTIRAGQAVAIVGANGSGKSTLVNLLPRFANPSQGQILIDGIELPQLRLADLRDAIAWVPQETRLFEGTIADNIRYGRPDATREEVEEAARLARVLDFTSAWTEGLDTAVGEHGRSLSGGQRQRIALARAIVRQPQILILDEPASAIDAQSEQLIYAALREFAQGRTVLLITHVFAPHVLGWIDEIVVLDRGRVAGQGRYADLAATCPPFQQLVESQRQAA